MATANYLLQSPYTPSKTITDHLLALMRPYCPACPTFPYAAPNSQHCLCPCSPLTSSLYCMCMSASAQLRHSSLPTLLIHHQPSSFWRVNSPSQSRTRSKARQCAPHVTPPHRRRLSCTRKTCTQSPCLQLGDLWLRRHWKGAWRRGRRRAQVHFAQREYADGEVLRAPAG